jgi:hypothetical protein
VGGFVVDESFPGAVGKSFGDFVVEGGYDDDNVAFFYFEATEVFFGSDDVCAERCEVEVVDPLRDKWVVGDDESCG